VFDVERADTDDLPPSACGTPLDLKRTLALDIALALDLTLTLTLTLTLARTLAHARRSFSCKILVASGDFGASGGSEGCYPASDPLFANDISVWPQASPWVTVVGGTQFLATADDPQAEVVCSSATGGGITSGGGFAGPAFSQDLFSTPAWQKTAVERYLADNNQSTFAAFPTAAGTPGWNPTGRAYPDIAAYGAWFPIVDVDGESSAKAGTSLSAPMAAALFSLANQALMRDGYDTIGYANPMLYWMGENCTDAFNDITIGDNHG
jgi:tripeptidyl-peptidase-1